MKTVRSFVGCVVLSSLFSGAVSLRAETAPAWKSAPLELLPTPKQCRGTGRRLTLSAGAKIAVASRSDTPILRTATQLAVDTFRRKGLHGARVVSQGETDAADLTVILDRIADADCSQTGPLPRLQPQGYFLRVTGEASTPRRVRATILGADDAGILYGVYTLLKTFRFDARGATLPEVEILDEPALGVRGISPQWAWYIGERGPYDAALWNLDRWKVAIDFMAEYRYNLLALCTYGKFPFPLADHRDRCAVDLPFELWSPELGRHTIRWTHPAYKDDFLGDLVQYAHARGIRVLIYCCLNLQDEIGSRRWTNASEIQAYVDIQQHLLKHYGVDGFLFESLESLISHPDDLARFGNDRWSRLRADVFLTRRYTEAIRAVKGDATIGLVDHYLFFDWDARHVAQREGLEQWKSQLPPDTLLAYLHTPEGYDVFPRDRIWTYVFGPRGMPKPALQIDLADFCSVPRAKRVAGAYYVTYDWTPHEPNYLCFAESAWGNYAGLDRDAFSLYWCQLRAGDKLAMRSWKNVKRELYGDGAEFGEGVRRVVEAGAGEIQPEAALRQTLASRLVPALDADDLAAAGRVVNELETRRGRISAGLSAMRKAVPDAVAQMISAYPIKEHLDKATRLAEVQLAWAEFCCHYAQAAVRLARCPTGQTAANEIVAALQTAARATHASIRQSLARAYFSYPHDVLGKYEFLAGDGAYLDDLRALAQRMALACDASGRRLRLRNVALDASISADSVYKAGHYDAAYAADDKRGTPSRGVWVSAETHTPHDLTLQFKTARPVRAVVINWVRDATRDWVARDFAVEIHAGATWRTVYQAVDNRQLTTVAKLDPPALADQVRIRISRGSPSRGHLAAIDEIQVLAVQP